MNHHYKDIRERIPEEPLWFDEHAVPRYTPFTPDDVADVYAEEVALLEIACQACRRRFLVALSWSLGDAYFGRQRLSETTSLEYGDPPNMECCPSGPTMSSDFIRVVEFWKMEHMDWQRAHHLEERT